MRRKYRRDTSSIENAYYIDDPSFIRLVLSELMSAGYISEDEAEGNHFLGSELQGHVLQRYLPGQFFVLDGKYYEMLSLAPSGRVLIRRAADHIRDRATYRQVREYAIDHIVPAQNMGDTRNIAGVRVTRAFADISVSTPCYWMLPQAHDYGHGKRVVVNNIPQRRYMNKSVLVIELPSRENAAVTSEILYTIALLFNEFFQSLFAENSAFICAVTSFPEEWGDNPMTYHLTKGAEPNCIYIIEDSQLDLGLLVSVERNLTRLLEISADYLNWHNETLEESLHPKQEELPELPDLPDAPTPEKKSNPIARALRAIGKFFAKVWAAICAFFRKLFKRNKTKPTQAGDEAAPNCIEPSAGDNPATEADATAQDAVEPNAPSEALAVQQPSEDLRSDVGEPAKENDCDAQEEKQGDFIATSDDDKETPPIQYADPISDDDCKALGIRMMQEDVSASDESPTIVEAEDDGAQRVNIGATESRSRRPYHERYYLLFGDSDKHAWIDVTGTSEYLNALGFKDNALFVARKNVHASESNFDQDPGNGHECDFCGVALMGTEYEVLKDGRERCMQCGKTAIREGAAFEDIFRSVVTQMEASFGIKLSIPVKVRMVNAKTLHRKIGKSFIPSKKSDGRVLGVAIKSNDGYTLLVENGAPRAMSIMTMVHELTHIWQYENWNAKSIRERYAQIETQVYEGMAVWVSIRYMYLVGDKNLARREELRYAARNDEYGYGYILYLREYPMKQEPFMSAPTPFSDPDKPLKM